MNDFNFKIPNIAKGTVIPRSVAEKEIEESKQRESRNIQFRHDWFITLFNVIGGAIAGLITSIIFWLITE